MAFWIVALTAGALSAVLLKAYVSRRAQTTAPQMAKVVAASMDLPVATTLRAEHLRTIDWPEASQPPGALHDPKEAIGRVLVVRVSNGEPLLPAKLAARDAGRGLAALIPNDMRAVAVRVDDVVGVAGFVHPEDRVDVIVTMRPTKPVDAEPTSKVILQNVKVLAVGKEIEASDGARAKPLPVTVATLLVGPDDSEKLALAANQGKLLLALRAWTDTATPETAGVVPTALIGTAPPVRTALATAPRSRTTKEQPQTTAPVATVAPPRKDVVEILRGDRFEERKFDAKEDRP